MNNIIITEPSKNIRAMAREALAGKWKIAAVATLVYLAALILPSTILNIFFAGENGESPLATLYTFLVTGAFTVGYSMFCMNLFRNKDIEVEQIFYGFEKFGKALGLYFMMCLVIILWSLLFIIPGIIAAFRYSQVFYVMVDHPEYGIMQCIDESKRMMRGNKYKYFCLELSFIGWGILATLPVAALTTAFTISESPIILIEILTCIGMVGYIWLTPYITVANVGFYEMANGNLRPGIIELNDTNVDEGNIAAETFVDEKDEDIVDEKDEDIVDEKDEDIVDEKIENNNEETIQENKDQI